MATKYRYRLKGTHQKIALDRPIDQEYERIAKKTGADSSTPAEKGYKPPAWWVEHREAQEWQYLGTSEVPAPATK